MLVARVLRVRENCFLGSISVEDENPCPTVAGSDGLLGVPKLIWQNNPLFTRFRTGCMMQDFCQSTVLTTFVSKVH